MDQNKTKGVYFVANDRVIEMTIAFLNSFRKYNPEIPLCLIPFRNDLDQLRKLQSKYKFIIYNDHDFLTFCDEISIQFHGKIMGHYRKLAIWQGPFDEFVYIDIDMLVLKNIDFVYQILNYYDFITSWSNLASTEKWVWKESIYESNVLNQEQIKYAANTGFIVSKKTAITPDDIKAKLASALQLKKYMELRCIDQPLINYLIVTSNKRFSSLYLLLDSPHYPENNIEFWAGNKKSDLMKNMQTMLNGKLRDIFLIHWAGTWQLRKIEIQLYILLSVLKIRKTIWSTSLFMPFKKLWKQYRFADLGTPTNNSVL
jgi:hypothetical protein